VRELGMSDVEVLHGRAEQLVRERTELAGRHDVVAMRSVGRVDSLVPIAGTYLRPGGLCVISCPPVESDAAPVPAVPGFAAERRLIDLPPLALTRAFLVCEEWLKSGRSVCVFHVEQTARWTCSTEHGEVIGQSDGDSQSEGRS
jgi:hypothetical protein